MNTLNLEKEFQFRTSRSSGSGGQHVNKVSTKVELLFDINASTLLDTTQKENLLKKLRNRISQKGILSLSYQRSRSQKRNKDAVIDKFYQLIHEALLPQKERKATKIPKAIKAKRLQKKRLQSQKKADRKKAKSITGLSLLYSTLS